MRLIIQMYALGSLALFASACKTTNTSATAAAESADSGGKGGLQPTDPGYEAMTAAQKDAVLWNNITQSRYTTLPAWTGKEALQIVIDGATLFPARTKAYYQETMSHASDEIPSGRKKRIHTLGSIAKIKFVAASSSPYSGLFAGVDHGFVRTSIARSPQPTHTTPGLAIKFLIDGQQSRNFMAMYSLDGQEGYDYFKNEFSNVIPKPTDTAVKILSSVFSRVAEDPRKVDVKFLGEVDQTGATATTARGPAQIFLVPNKDALSSLNFSDTAHEVRNDFAAIPTGTKLYTVYGVDVENSSDRTYAGDIITTSEFVASDYGDTQIFFRHQLFYDQKAP